jgi:hypothetical protein
VPIRVTVAALAPKFFAKNGWEGMIRPNPITSRRTIRNTASRGEGVFIGWGW